MYHKEVGRNVAKNPIARAIARRALEDSITDHRIRFYLAKKGDPCAEECNAVGVAFSVLCLAAEMSKDFGPEHPAVRILRGGMSAVAQMAERDSYDPTNTVAIDRAFDAALDLNKALPPDLVSKSWNILKHAAMAQKEPGS